jgi:hypothetical protein
VAAADPAGRTALRTPMSALARRTSACVPSSPEAGFRNSWAPCSCSRGDPGFDPAAAGRLLAERASAVPRLRQRLVRLPLGAGRPVWLDDPGFDPTRHVRQVRCPPPGEEQALLDVAVAVACDPLPPDRPLWTAALCSRPC